MGGPNITATVIEMWVEYAIGILVLFLRIYARFTKLVGWNWEGDDYLAVVAIILLTMEISMCQVIVNLGTITGMTDEVALTLTPEQYRSHESGAKWLFAAWYTYVSMIWSLKGIMLFFFARVTKTLPEERLVKWTSGIVVLAYLATLGAVTGHCWPIHRSWQVYPYPGDDCSQNRSKYYALITTNVITDVMIILVPIPLLWRLQTTIRNKFAFGLMFCAGFFIIICTVCRCVICLKTPERLDLGLNWSVRETVVAVICTNAPSIKPLLAFGRNKGTSSGSENAPPLVTIGGSGSYKMSRMQRLPDETCLGSQEHIIESAGCKGQTSNAADDRSSNHTTQGRNAIIVTTEYWVDQDTR